MTRPNHVDSEIWVPDDTPTPRMLEEMAEARVPKRYIVTRRNGSLEDWGAEDVQFTNTHVLFLDAGQITHAVHADEIREMEVQAA